MFYSHLLLARKALMRKIWMATTMHAKMSKMKLSKIDIIHPVLADLNEGWKAKSVSGVVSGRISVMRDRSSAMPSSQQIHGDRKDRNIDYNADPSADPEHDKSLMRSNKELLRCVDGGKEKREHQRDGHGVDQEDEGDFNNIYRLSNKPKSDQGREDENYGTQAHSSCHDNKGTSKSMHSQAFVFCEKVKDRMQSDEYQGFIKYLQMFSKEKLTKSQLHSLVSNVLGKYPDHLEGFDQFLGRCENMDVFLADLNRKETNSDGRDIQQDQEREDRDRLRDRESREHPDKSMYGSRASLSYNKEYLGKPIQELDLSDCERCTPSYRLLPQNYPIPVATQGTQLGAEVLNDHWVSVTLGSEDYSFKHMRKNQYEESLFQCEDDRFELDMLLESVNAAIKRVEELLDKINNNTIRTDVPIRMDEYFTALNLRCIELLYGDHGLDVMDVLKKNAILALPVIVTRLKQKHEEWARCRADFNKVWADIYAKNYHKSLDHRSFYFKQQDTKSLSTKALLTEIRDISEQRQMDDGFVVAIAAGNKEPVIPHMEFEYSDPEIHDDLYKLISYSCGEVCSVDQMDKVMKIWSTFIKSMFGVPARCMGAGGTEDVRKPKDQDAKSNVPATDGIDGISTGHATKCLESNPSRNLNETKPPKHWDSGSDGSKEDIILDASCSTGQPGRALPNGIAIGETAGSFTDPPSSCNMSQSSGFEQVPERTNWENTSGSSRPCNGTYSACEAKTNGESSHSLEGLRGFTAPRILFSSAVLLRDLFPMTSLRRSFSSKRSLGDADQHDKVRSIGHYDYSQKILLVGEGDFSFASCLATAFHTAPRLTATSLDSRDTVIENYSKGKENLKNLVDREAVVIHQVDVHSMNNHPQLHHQMFDRIVYNFPRACGSLVESSEYAIRLNQKVVRGFFGTARYMLEEKGEIHVTHKTTRPFDAWNIVGLANEVELELLRQVKFRRSDYPGYQNKRAYGGYGGYKTRWDETFPVGEAATFMFRKHR